MATANAKTDNLDKLAADFKAAATTLEGFATTLHKDVAALKWEGPSADKFKTAIKSEESMLANAITMMHTLAARLRKLAEDAADATRKLHGQEAQIVAAVRKEIADIEQQAKLANISVQDYLQQNPQISAWLKQEGAGYTSVTTEINKLGGI